MKAEACKVNARHVQYTRRWMNQTCDTLHYTRWEAGLVESLNHVQS